MTYGRNGWYHRMDSGRYVVVVASSRLLNSTFKRGDGYVYPPGSEQVLYMSAEDFTQQQIRRILVCGKDSQESLQEMHDKGRTNPKNALVTTCNVKEFEDHF